MQPPTLSSGRTTTTATMRLRAKSPLSVAAATAVELSAQALERGGEGSQGRLGDRVGKWRLTVRSERFLHVLILVRGHGGYLASLSR